MNVTVDFVQENRMNIEQFDDTVPLAGLYATFRNEGSYWKACVAYVLLQVFPLSLFLSFPLLRFRKINNKNYQSL